jgi:hydroxysqualene dehydroxylase
MKVLIIGAGWAGLTAAIEATRLGHQVLVVEATRTLGGRARALDVTLPDGSHTTLDNGQHILIGAYSATLQLMREIGIDTAAALQRIPLTLRYPDGSGLVLPDWRKPWFAGVDVAAGIVQAKGWSWGDKLSLLRAADAWRRARFICPAHYSVAQLCRGISPRVMADMIEPLVVSALNTPADRASGSVFLRVMRDALFAPGAGAVAGSNMLLPRQDLSALFPQAAVAWLHKNGATVLSAQRMTDLAMLQKPELLNQWIHGLQGNITGNSSSTGFIEPSWQPEATIIATPAAEAARLACTLDANNANAQDAVQAWAASAQALHYEAITTVYAHSATAQLPHTVMALHSNAQQPAQFVFDRAALTGQPGVLAFVVSASSGDAATLEQQVIAQGKAQLGLADLQPIKTIVEKRATFACTPGLQRPAMRVAKGVLACGDYVDGPYPATLEGAVRSGLAAARALATAQH